jgi:hypothetical protein
MNGVGVGKEVRDCGCDDVDIRSAGCIDLGGRRGDFAGGLFDNVLDDVLALL